MKNEILTLHGTISAEVAEQARASLKMLPGVQDVTFFAAPASLHLRLEDDAPSRAELTAALAKAGVAVEAAKGAHASGGCCGGCGS